MKPFEGEGECFLDSNPPGSFAGILMKRCLPDEPSSLTTLKILRQPDDLLHSRNTGIFDVSTLERFRGELYISTDDTSSQLELIQKSYIIFMEGKKNL